MPKRNLAAAVALTAGLLLSVRQADAFGPVYCTNCATQWSQMTELARQAQQIARQLQQYQLQLEQYANMVRNTTALPQEMWSNVQGDIMQVRNLSNMASILSGNSGSMLSRLTSVDAYGTVLSTPQEIDSQLTMWHQTIGNNLDTMGRTLGLQQGQEQNDALMLRTLEMHSQTANGQLEAIQAGNELAGANATQLYEIQQTLADTAQMQANQMAVHADRQAAEDQAMTDFLAGPSVPTTGYSRW